MKRSNRLVLLIGVFLAVVAFVGIILLSQSGPSTPATPTELPTVVATTDIPLGTRITADQVTVVNKPVTGRDADAYGDPSQVIGKLVRQPVANGAAISPATFGGGGQISQITCPALFRCMAVQVDQVSGVGTVIQTGDYVDMVVGFTGDKFPVITLNPNDSSFTVVSGINSTSVKLLLQGLQVVGTLLPPPPAQTQNTGNTNNGQPQASAGTALNGQQEIVILAVNAQQSEVVKFAQLDGSVTLVLRSPDDFIDPTTKAHINPVPDATTGIILKTLVDTYGVIPPELVETVLPAQTRK